MQICRTVVIVGYTGRRCAISVKGATALPVPTIIKPRALCYVGGIHFGTLGVSNQKYRKLEVNAPRNVSHIERAPQWAGVLLQFLNNSHDPSYHFKRLQEPGVGVSWCT